LRNQVFAGDALSHVAFTGGLGALAFGFAARSGVFTATVAVAILLAVLGGRARLNDVVTGVVFTWLLGLGVLFLSVFTSSRRTGNGAGAVRVLFGSIFGIDAATAAQTGWIAAGVVVAMLLISRPLLFATIDPGVAEARGIPVRALNVVFLVAAGVMIAQLVQVVGALLLLGLITTPAATAQRLTARPWRAMTATVAIAVATVWAGLWLTAGALSLAGSVSHDIAAPYRNDAGSPRQPAGTVATNSPFGPRLAVPAQPAAAPAWLSTRATWTASCPFWFRPKATRYSGALSPLVSTSQAAPVLPSQFLVVLGSVGRSTSRVKTTSLPRSSAPAETTSASG